MIPVGPGEHGEWRRGAVLVPILANAPYGVVFVERARHLRRHPGQIGFPGGIAEPADSGDPVKTALRELWEELNVHPQSVKVVERLPDLNQALNRFVITPIVGILDASTCFSLDGDEIVGMFTVPLSSIVAPDALSEDAELSRTRGKAMYRLQHEGRCIWGFTARIVKSFVDAWNAPASSFRDTIEAALSLGPDG